MMLHLVQALLVKNAKVYMASRSEPRATQAISELKQETGKEAIFLELDLANLDSVTRASNEFKSKESSLHLLMNSGGVMIPPVEGLTSDGYDLQFGSASSSAFPPNTSLLRQQAQTS